MLFGVLGAMVTLADTARLFVRAANYSPVAVALWALWAAGLLAPLAWAVRDRDRARNYIALGYVMAILALRVIDVAMAR
jgi:hypothetical protein